MHHATCNMQHICTLGILKPKDRITGSAKLSTAIVTQTSYGLAANTAIFNLTLKHANHPYFSPELTLLAIENAFLLFIDLPSTRSVSPKIK